MQSNSVTTEGELQNALGRRPNHVYILLGFGMLLKFSSNSSLNDKIRDNFTMKLRTVVL